MGTPAHLEAFRSAVSSLTLEITLLSDFDFHVRKTCSAVSIVTVCVGNGPPDLRLWEELTKQQTGATPEAAAATTKAAGSQSLPGSTAAVDDDGGLGLLDLGEEKAEGEPDEFQLHAQKQFDTVYLHKEFDDLCLHHCSKSNDGSLFFFC